MFDSLKEKFQSSLEFSNRLIDETVERQVRFTTDMLTTSVESGKKLRSCTTISDVVEAQTEYLKEVQAQVTALSSEGTSSLKELRDSASEFVTGAMKFGAEEKAPKAASKKKAA